MLNALSSHVRNLGWATDSWSTSGMVAMSVTGRFLSIVRTTCRMEPTIADDGSVLFTTSSPPQNGACANGTYIIGAASFVNFESWMSPTMPTISRATGGPGGNPNINVCPSGFSFWKYTRANDALIMVTSG